MTVRELIALLEERDPTDEVIVLANADSLYAVRLAAIPDDEALKLDGLKTDTSIDGVMSIPLRAVGWRKP